MRRVRFALLALLAAVLLLTFTAPSARAVDIPGIDICPKMAPVASLPNEGVVGVVGEKPQALTNFDEKHIWSSGGFAGMYASPYDLGCAANPASYLKVAQAQANAKATNGLLGIGYIATSITDSIDRRAWAPEWIGVFMGDFATRATEVIGQEILYPLLGLGLLVASCVMILRFRGGNISKAASATAWVVLALMVSAFFIAAPTLLSSDAQKAGASTVAALNGGENASDAQTDRVADAVHYQGWLRRTFGTDNSAVATKYGPSLLVSERITWAELATNNTPEELRALRKQKAEDFKTIAAKVKDEDPGAYQWLTGQNDGSGIALTEMLYALVAAFFRFMVDLLLVMATILISVLALTWLAASPVIVTPFGRLFGIGLLNTTVRALLYVLEAAIGSWLFGIYMQVAMQPGQSTWWSILLLIVGTIVAWTLIRPDRKALALATMGHVHGTGRLMRLVTAAAVAYLGGRAAGRATARRMREDEEVDITPVPSTEYVAPPVPALTASAPTQPVEVHVRLTIADERGLPPGRESDVVDGEVVWDSAAHQAVASGTVYQRPISTGAPMPVPPPPGTLGEVELYQRPAPTDPDDVYVPCPWCRGSGCGHCEHEGTVPKWVRDEVSPE
jgi:hypothetical protein